jgi:hypothetical protein
MTNRTIGILALNKSNETGSAKIFDRQAVAAVVFSFAR